MWIPTVHHFSASSICLIFSFFGVNFLFRTLFFLRFVCDRPPFIWFFLSSKMMLAGGLSADAPVEAVSTWVCDIGAHQFRAGMSGDTVPVSFSSSVGYVLENNDGGNPPAAEPGSPLRLKQMKRSFVASALETVQPDMIIRPVFNSSGLVDSWGGYEELWDYFFSSSCRGRHAVTPAESAFILAEQPFVPPSDRQKICELLFEKYTVPAVSMVKTPVLGTFANARTSAVCVDIGHSVVSSTVVQDGFFNRNSVHKSNFAGHELTLQMYDSIQKNSPGSKCLPSYLVDSADYDEERFHDTYTRFHGLETARSFKEGVCYVSKTPLIELPEGGLDAQVASAPYQLPDGTVIEASGKVRIEIPEMLFDPPSGGRFSRVEPLGKLVYSSLRMCNADFARDMWSHVVVIGGSSALPGITERLNQELAPLTPKSIPVNVISAQPQNRGMSAWLGGSILGTLPYNQIAMTKAEYAEHGAAFIGQRCA